MKTWVVFLVAFSLSMDAFSLAISLGTGNVSKKNMFSLSLIVGLFHFFMPILGSILGTSFIKYLNVNSHFLSGIIFSYIALQMIKEFFDQEDNSIKFRLIEMLIFALGVSLDSFGVGFSIGADIQYMYFYSSIFALFSFSFTLLGLILGNVLSNIIGKYAILFGSIIMCVLAISNFVNFFTFG